MDYEEKYNNLLGRLKALVSVQPEITKGCFLKQFPELTESEDEKIRKGLLKLLNELLLLGGVASDEWDRKECEKYVAWLEKQGEQKPVETKPHLPDGSIPYDRGFEEAQEYLSKRGFDVPWNDCDVYVDERHITQTVANVLTWADEHPKQKPEWSEEDKSLQIDF